VWLRPDERYNEGYNYDLDYKRSQKKWASPRHCPNKYIKLLVGVVEIRAAARIGLPHLSTFSGVRVDPANERILCFWFHTVGFETLSSGAMNLKIYL